MEVAPVLIALPLLWLTHRRYPLTPLLYTLIFFHALILIFSGMYSYARVPLGFEVQQWLDLAATRTTNWGISSRGWCRRWWRARSRAAAMQGRKMLGFVVCCIALAISAVYELIEWWAALALGQAPTSFFGTQGDPWDTQSDMFCALLGALCGLLLFAGWQDWQIRRLRR